MVDVCVGNNEWYNDLDTTTSTSSVTFKIERTSALTPSVESSSPYNLIKLPMSTRAVRMRLVNGTTVLDQQEVVILTASTTENAEKAILTQERIFNALTNNGQAQGIYLSQNDLYINASYIGSGAINIGYLDNNQTWHETFYANAETGTVRINANSLKIQGTNVVDAAVAQAVPQAALEAEDSILNSVDSQDKIFDALIGGDNQQGIVLDNGKLYLSANYIRTGTLKVGGTGTDTDGAISIKNASNKEFGSITYEGITFKKKSSIFSDATYGMRLTEQGLSFYRNTSNAGSITLAEQYTQNGNNLPVFSHMITQLQAPEVRIFAQDGRDLILGHYDHQNTPINTILVTVSEVFVNTKLQATQLHAQNGYDGTVKLPIKIDSSTGTVEEWVTCSVVDGIIIA